jgi:hypothetical protein
MASWFETRGIFKLFLTAETIPFIAMAGLVPAIHVFLV